MSQTVIKITSMLEPLARSRRHHARWRLLVATEATCWLEGKTAAKLATLQRRDTQL
jgi:hypothetical protein